MKKIVFSVAVLLVFSGCSSVGSQIPQSKITQIQEGKTTKTELFALLGKPSITNLTPDGKQSMLYFYQKTKMRASSFIPVLNWFIGGVDMKQQSFQVLIDENDIVEKAILTDSETPINSGMANVK